MMTRKLSYDINALVGSVYAQLTVMSWKLVGNNRHMLVCRCDCGREIDVRPIEFVRRNLTRCGACRKAYLIGKRYGSLTVIAHAGYTTGNRRYRWLCQCDCGEQRLVETSHLKHGQVVSCGCSFRTPEARFLKGKGNRLPDGIALRNRVIAAYKANARKKRRDFLLTEEEILELLNGSCFYCGVPPSRTLTSDHSLGSFTYNGIDRLNNDLGYVQGNVVSCCKDCNYKKGDQHVDDFLAWIKLVASHRNL